MKKIVRSCLRGALWGSVVMNIYLIFGTALALEYSGLMDGYEEMFGKTSMAAFLQLVSFMLMGAGIAFCTEIRKQERLSLLVQTIAQYAALALTFFPFCLCSGLIAKNAAGVLAYAGILGLLYLVIWAAQYSSLKLKIAEMNASLEKKEYAGKGKAIPYMIVVFGMYYIIPAAVFLVERDYYQTAFVVNLLNYVLYPILLVVVGILCGKYAGVTIGYPVSAAVLIVPISLFLYQEVVYTVLLCAVFGGIALVGNIIGGVIKKARVHK